MAFSFEAKIYKVGINPCVKVPFEATASMTASKGYIPVIGKIGEHPFHQTLCPVKNEEYRLYINGPMLKGSGTKVGDIVKLTLEQDNEPETRYGSMPGELKKALEDHDLVGEFEKLTPYRQKEIIRYLNYLKTEEALLKNIEKVIAELKKKLEQAP